MNTEYRIINGVEINLDHVHALIAENRKLDAIKYMVDHTNISLLEAKNLVDDLSNKKGQKIIELDILEQVKELLKQNKKIEAVKLVKSISGLGLKESKDFVDNLDHRNFDELFEVFKGKSVENFASEKKRTSTNTRERKSNLFLNDSSAKMKKTLILLAVGIAIIIYYFYQK